MDDKIEETRAELLEQVDIVHNIGTVQTLVDQRAQEDIPIAVGYRPSGHLHLGNMITFFIAAHVANQLGVHRSRIVATNCDLELPGTQTISEVKEGLDEAVKANFSDAAVYFRHVAADSSGLVSISEFNEAPIRRLFERLTAEYHVETTHFRLGDVQAEEGYRESLIRFCERAEDVAVFFPDFRGEALKRSQGGAYIFPVCGTCHTGNKSGSKYKGDGKVEAYCFPCEETWEVDLRDPDQEIATNFLVDPVRDLSDPTRAAVHVFGGDYTEPIEGQFSKLEKVAGIMQVVKDEGQTVPILYGGPVVYSESGRKMGKSGRNGLEYGKLEKVLGDQLMAKMRSYIGHIIQQGILHVDFTVTRDKLL